MENIEIREYEKLLITLQEIASDVQLLINDRRVSPPIFKGLFIEIIRERGIWFKADQTLTIRKWNRIVNTNIPIDLICYSKIFILFKNGISDRWILDNFNMSLKFGDFYCRCLIDSSRNMNEDGLIVRLNSNY